MQRASNSTAGSRRKRSGRSQAPRAAAEPPAGDLPPEVARLLGALGVDDAGANALHALIARALESGARAGKRKGSGLGKARSLASKKPAKGLDPFRLVPLVLAVRDQLQRASPGARPSRARHERLDRAADAAIRGLVEAEDARRQGDRAGAPAPGAEERARELLQRIVSLTPDAVVSVRVSGRLGLWSSAASRLTGRRRWEVHRRGLASAFRKRSEYESLLEELDEKGRVSGREVVMLNAAGEEVPARIFAVRLKDEAGQAGSVPRRDADPDRYLLVFHDLSELHNIRRRLIETEKLSAMAKIAGSVAHEFRNPLNSLFLSTDLLEDELEGRGAIRKAISPTLAAIREEVERLNQIITHYLSLSKISSASPEKMDLGRVAAAFAEENAQRLEAEGVELRIRADDGGHDITADPNQVRRILVNLVENAVDAVQGEATDDESRAKRGRVTIYVRRMRRSVKATVKDNGPGIPEDVRERVFEPFFTSKAGGSGLGLYLVREVAIASGGTISLSSAQGRGTSISIRWPHAQHAEDTETTG